MDQDAASWKHGLEWGALSDLGLRRTNNQDSIAVALAGSREEWRQRGHLFLVADGMGAHAAGELASRLAADSIPLTYRKLRDCSPPEALRKAIEEANQQIHARGQASDDFRGMGTTASVLVLLPRHALVAQVGDSRIYRWREGRLEQWTFDHSLVWEMAAAGQISGEDIESYIPRNIITRSLGPSPDVKVDLEGLFPLQLGDTFLLCSDGLSGPVKDPELAAIIGCLPPHEAAQALVDLANLRGGPDNISVIIIRLAEPQAIEWGEAGHRSAACRTAPLGPVPSLVWTLAGVFSLAGLGLLAMRHYLVGMASLAAAALTALGAWMQSTSISQTHDDLPHQPLGNAPHTSCDGRPGLQVAETLASTVRQLRDAAVRGAWVVDWPQCNTLESQAAAAAQADDYAGAVGQYCRAISLMMHHLRRQRDAESPGQSPFG